VGTMFNVNKMVDGTIGRKLSMQEHGKFFIWAVMNGICEEFISRGFFMYEFLYVGHTSQFVANFGQAFIFGFWHYHGIPSGLTGVALTFIYGFIMGLLWEYGDGLLLPIIAHSMADYFIFAVVVRKRKLATTEKEENAKND